MHATEGSLHYMYCALPDAAAARYRPCLSTTPARDERAMVRLHVFLVALLTKLRSSTAVGNNMRHACMFIVVADNSLGFIRINSIELVCGG